MPASADESIRLLLGTLKDVHNRGADLYNTGDHAAAYRLYQGALVVARAFLAARPDIRAAVADGLDEVEQAGGGVGLKAFRLHEVLEHVRTELKHELRRREGAPARLAGTVSRGGRPAGQVMVMLTVPGDPVAAVAATTGPGGEFVLAALPGDYVLTAAGAGVPAQFTTVAASPLRVKVAPGENTVAVKLD